MWLSIVTPSVPFKPTSSSFKFFLSITLIVIRIPSQLASASGRKRPLKTAVLERFERPLSGKADVQILVSEKSLRNDRFTPGSGH